MARLKDVAKVIIFLIGGFAIIVVGGFMMRSVAKLWDNNTEKKTKNKHSSSGTIMSLTIAFLVMFVLALFIQFSDASIGQYSVNLTNDAKEVTVDKQVQIAADLTNNQDRDQPFAYLVQIQNEDGVTVSLSWITGSLAPGQSMAPSQSWTPTIPGIYNAQIFVWKSIDDPDALSMPLSLEINVVETKNT